MKDEPPYLRGGAAFDLTLLSLVGVAALGFRHELAIGLWLTILGVVVNRLRSRDREPIPRAQLVLARAATGHVAAIERRVL
jgi:hypothetical protein